MTGRLRGIYAETTHLSLPRRVVLLSSALAYLCLWIGGVIQHFFIGNIRAEQNWIAALFLFLAGSIVSVTTVSSSDLYKLIGVALLGFIFEVCGVRYGLPFGKYNYTEALNPSLLGVPLVMALAWMTLVAYLKQMQLYLNWPVWVEALVCAAWMMAIDLVIDPLAANQLGYWRWVERGSYYGIPVSNFAGWFITSLIVFILFRDKWRFNSWPRLVGISIILFFALIALAHQLFLASLIGFGLFLLHLVFREISHRDTEARRKVKVKR